MFQTKPCSVHMCTDLDFFATTHWGQDHIQISTEPHLLDVMMFLYYPQAVRHRTSIEHWQWMTDFVLPQIWRWSLILLLNPNCSPLSVWCVSGGYNAFGVKEIWAELQDIVFDKLLEFFFEIDQNIFKIHCSGQSHQMQVVKFSRCRSMHLVGKCNFVPYVTANREIWPGLGCRLSHWSCRFVLIEIHWETTDCSGGASPYDNIACGTNGPRRVCSYLWHIWCRHIWSYICGAGGILFTKRDRNRSFFR